MLKLVNVIFLQWFFIRLTRCESKLIEKFEPHSVSIMPGGGASLAGIVTGYKKLQWYSIQGFIVPCTGWCGSFKYLKGPFFWRVTKQKEMPIEWKQ
jgi:hypothetical protein